ncbi:SAM-dependent methyltransferase [Novosphingobium sp. AP12]|uniref:SAM-dependent methyltransferase n=1 Tax=Novosphingobium sp. AP12 TaxID=1144305 RepID=UPI000271D8AD|nr:SAM-dependent methyltransferase [Novosphingobium sp. AP12]EJL29602.1 Nodulation protein S (NodS) [Novosphingobium sp. AP12]
MTPASTSLGPDYFESMFRGTKDPWDLETSVYERDKYAATIAALRARKYQQGFEVGCAKGVLTNELAGHCDALLAVDVSATALKAARARCAVLDHVSFANMVFPQVGPVRLFDLVVLSEVVYYWDDHDIRRAAQWIAAHVEAGGDILLVHWTGETDYPQTGDEAVGKLQDLLGGIVKVAAADRTDRYRLDLWQRRP